MIFYEINFVNLNMRAECENVFITIYMTLHHLAQHSAHPLACDIPVSQDKINNAQKGNIWHWTLCDRASWAYTPLITCTMVSNDMKSVKLCHSLALGFINISTNFDDFLYLYAQNLLF